MDGSAKRSEATAEKKRVRQTTEVNLVNKRPTNTRVANRSWLNDNEDNNDQGCNSDVDRLTNASESLQNEISSTLRLSRVIISDNEDEDDCCINEFVSQCPPAASASRKQKTQLKLTSFGNVVDNRLSRSATTCASSTPRLLNGNKDQPAETTCGPSSFLAPNPLKMRLRVHIADNLILVPVLQRCVYSNFLCVSTYTNK